MDEIKQALKEEGFNGIEKPDKKQLTDKFSMCPVCGVTLDGGDAYNELAKLGINTNKSHEEILQLASQYGWTPTNKVRFTRLIVQDINGIVLYKCPSIRCSTVFGGKNLFAYESTQDALENIPLIDNPKDIEKHFKGVRDIDNIEIEGEKAVSDMTDDEIRELIERIIVKYRTTIGLDARRRLKRDYLELAAWYNEEFGVEVFKMSL